jgi:hypothetical protein
MILDDLGELFDSRALAAGATVSDIVDYGVSRSVGPGRVLFCVVAIDSAPVATGTYSLAIQTADESGFASPDTVQTLQIPANAPQGEIIAAGIGHGARRFVRLVATLGGISPAITLSAFLTDQEPTSHRSYPDASQP